MTMSTTFPKTCKLSPSEKDSLRELLEPGESPCEGCGINSICDGPDVQSKEEAALFADPTGKCFLCGADTGNPSESRLIAGTFHRCREHEDEYVFAPLEKLEGNRPDDADFFKSQPHESFS